MKISLLKKYCGEFLLIVGVILLAFSTLHTYVHASMLAKNIPVEEKVVPVGPSVTEQIPTKLKIEQIVAVPIEEGKYLQNGEWTISKTAAMHWQNSSVPEFNRNIVIYGHNTKNIFGALKTVQVGQEIELTVRSGKTYHYTVAEIQIVEPDQVQFLAPTDEETLTVYTCIGWMDSKRLILRAVRK